MILFNWEKDNRQIVEIPLKIHLVLRTDKNKKLKQLKNFLERLKICNVENYVCAYKIYGIAWRFFPLRNPENWEQLLKVIKDRGIFNK